MPRHVERELPQSHRLGAIKEGFIDFGAPADTQFIFVGHRISQILINGDVVYTFVHSASGILEKVTNNLRGTVLTFSYTPNGFILEALTSDVP